VPLARLGPNVMHEVGAEVDVAEKDVVEIAADHNSLGLISKIATAGEAARNAFVTIVGAGAKNAALGQRVCDCTPL
jgi:hypothetical protein